MNKRLFIIRHGRKDSENISAEQIIELQQNGIPAINKIVAGKNIIVHAGGELDRTKQTTIAWEIFSDRTNLCQIIRCFTTDERFGNDKMFNTLISNAEMKNEAGKSNWFQAAQKYNPEFLAKTQEDLLKAVSEIFSNIDDNDIVFMADHSPLIEWLVYAIDTEGKISQDTKLKELNGFIISESNGQLEVIGTIGF